MLSLALRLTILVDPTFLPPVGPQSCGDPPAPVSRLTRGRGPVTFRDICEVVRDFAKRYVKLNICGAVSVHEAPKLPLIAPQSSTSPHRQISGI